MIEHTYEPQLPRIKEMTKALATLVPAAVHGQHGYNQIQLRQDLLGAVKNTGVFIEQMEFCINASQNVIDNTEAGLFLSEELAEKLRQNARKNLALYQADLEAAQLLMTVAQGLLTTLPPSEHVH